MLAAGDILDFKDGHNTITAHLHSGKTEIYRATRSTDNADLAIKIGDGDEVLTLAGLLMDADPKLPPYLPKFMSSIILDGEFASAFQYLDGFYNLNEVRDHYPNGIELRDMAWMFRRLLVVLGFAHRAGYFHGAVLPQHVMIHPSAHGLVLLDWTQAEQIPDTEDDDLLDIPFGQQDWYPPDGLGTTAGPATDLFMAANLMSWLMGGDAISRTLPAGIEREYRVFLNTLMSIDHTKRPGDAWTVLGHFDSLIEGLYGKRKFHPFHIPPSEA